jgi:hypothetical protein
MLSLTPCAASREACPDMRGVQRCSGCARGEKRGGASPCSSPRVPEAQQQTRGLLPHGCCVPRRGSGAPTNALRRCRRQGRRARGTLRPVPPPPSPAPAAHASCTRLTRQLLLSSPHLRPSSTRRTRAPLLAHAQPCSVASAPRTPAPVPQGPARQAATRPQQRRAAGRTRSGNRPVRTCYEGNVGQGWESCDAGARQVICVDASRCS